MDDTGHEPGSAGGRLPAGVARPVRPPRPTSGRERRRRPRQQAGAGTPTAVTATAVTTTTVTPTALHTVEPPTLSSPCTVLPDRVHRRGRRAVRVVSWIALVTSLSLLAATGTGYALLNRYDGNIQRIGGVLADDQPDPGARDARNVLIVGSDSRDELSDAEDFQGAGEDFVTGQRSDVIILAHLYGDSDQAQLVSIPRDSWVDVPAFADPLTGAAVPARQEKINKAFFDGGPALLVATVEQLAGVRIDHYLQVDFTGFRSMVDELDGVDICLSRPARDVVSGIDLDAGRHTLSGEQALSFVRQREGFARADIDRIQRQQRLLGSMVRKMLSAGTLLNPLKLNGLLEAATRSLQVDEDLTLDELRQLATRFRTMDAGGIGFVTVPISDINALRDRQSVVLLDDVAAGELFDQLRRDIPPGTPAAPDVVPPDASGPVVPPEQVAVQVFNGTGIPGLAGRAADDLRAAGFVLAGAPGDRSTGARSTVVLHGPDRADSARTVASALPGAVLELDPSLNRTLEVVVGSDYDGVTPVRVAPAPAPEPPASPTPRTAAEDMCAP